MTKTWSVLSLWNTSYKHHIIIFFPTRQLYSTKFGRIFDSGGRKKTGEKFLFYQCKYTCTSPPISKDKTYPIFTSESPWSKLDNEIN